MFVSLTSSAVVAELVGVEPLIGAFFVGVGLNRLVPNASPLMAVTDFFGNAFFIPRFLVSVGLLFSMSVAQAAATLAATVIGYNIGLYGSDVVNAVMVVVAVSLIVTSIGTNRFARQIPPPVDERRRAGETIRGRPGAPRARGRRGDDAPAQPVGVHRTQPGSHRDRRIAAVAGMARS